MANDEIGSMIVRVGLDGSNMDRGLKSINQRMAATKSELKATASQFDNFGSSVDGLRAKQENLSRQQQLQSEKVQILKNKYDDLVRLHGAESEAALKAARSLNTATAAYNNMGREVDTIGGQLDEMTSELDRQNSVLGRSERALSSFSSGADKVGKSLMGVGVGLTAGLSVPLAALGGLALKAADDLQKAEGKIQASLGVSAEQAKELTESAREVYTDGWGESIGQITNDLATLKQNLGTVDDKTLESAQILGQLSENADIDSVSRALRNMTASFPGATQQKSLDLITKVLQTSGDASGDLLDTFNEYSGVVSSAGISMEDFANILINGSKAGARNYDVLADTLKEFNIRAKDGSELTAEGFAAIGLSASEMGAAIAEGGDKGQEAFQKTLEALGKIEDPIKRNEAGVALFGTKFEDLEWQTIKSLGTMENSLGEFEGATAKAGEALQDNLGVRAQKELRQLGDALIPFGEVLMDVVEPALDSVSGKIEEFTNWMKGLSPESQKTILAVAGIVAAIGPLAIGLGAVITSLGALSGGLALLTNPIGLSVLALGGLALGFAGLDAALDKTNMKSDIFAGDVSNATEKAVGSYMKLRNGAKAELDLLAFQQGEVTDEIANSLVTKYQKMGDQVLLAMQQNHKDQLDAQRKLFADSNVLSEEEEAIRTQQLMERQLAEIDQHTKQEARKLDIIRNANDENRKLTDVEIAELAALDKQSQNRALEELTKSQEEQLTIKKNMKNQRGVLDAEEALNTLKLASKSRDEVVKESQKLYDEKIKAIEEGRDVTGTITAEEAVAMIAEAEKSKDGVVGAANNQYNETVTAAYDKAGANADQINWETNAVLGWQEKMTNGIIKASNWVKSIFGIEQDDLIGSLKETGAMKQARQAPQLKATKKHANGTPNGHTGGLAIVSEKGRELINEPGIGTYLSGSSGSELRNLRPGTSVLPNHHTERLLKNYGFPGYENGIGDFFSSLLNGAGNAWDFVSDKFGLSGLVDDIPKTAKAMMGNPLKSVGNMATDWLKGLFSDMGSIGGSFSGGGADMARQAISQALAMLGKPQSFLNGLMTIAQKESGFNPRAINNWDINAQRGDPSIGLFQVIGSTFARWKYPGMNDRTNPLHSALAAIRYMDGRYGGIQNHPGLKSMARGGGYLPYATGGEINSPQMALLGENGYKEWVITSEPKYRKNNLSMWMDAGQALGIPNVSQNVSSPGSRNSYGGSTTEEINVNIAPAPIVIDKRVLGEIVFEVVNELTQQNTMRSRRFGGDPLV